MILKATISISLNSMSVQLIDEMVKEQHFRNRSDAMQAAVNLLLKRSDTRPPRPVLSSAREENKVRRARKVCLDVLNKGMVFRVNKGEAEFIDSKRESAAAAVLTNAIAGIDYEWYLQNHLLVHSEYEGVRNAEMKARLDEKRQKEEEETERTSRAQETEFNARNIANVLSQSDVGYDDGYSNDAKLRVLLPESQYMWAKSNWEHVVSFIQLYRGER